MDSAWFSFLETRFFNYLIRALILEQGLVLILRHKKETSYCLKRAFGICLIMFALLPHSILDPVKPKEKNKANLVENKELENQKSQSDE